MTSVWKRLQRVNQRASKFCFSLHVTEVQLETASGAQPKQVNIIWTRRSRRLVTSSRPWEPSLQNPMKGVAIWPNPDNLDACVTLFKNPRSDDFEDKEWKLVVEDPSVRTKRRQLGVCTINMKKYVSIEASQQTLTLALTPMSKKVINATLKIRISCVFLKEGKATDEDLQSLASLMSTSTYGDIAPLEDFDEEDDTVFDESKEKELLLLTSQIQSLTSSVSENTLKDCPTPLEEDPPESVIRSNRISVVPNLIRSDTTKFLKQESVTETPEFEPSNEGRVSQSDEKISPAENKAGHEECASGQDLLEWCKSVTADCANVKVSDFTTSWKDGLGFCAIIHHFRPDLINFASLDPSDAKTNCRIAFDAGDILGVARVLDPNDLVAKRCPDKLMIMTYLHQLKAYFTSHQSSLQEIGTEMDNFKESLEESWEKGQRDKPVRGSSLDETRRKLTGSNSEYLLRSNSQDSDTEKKNLFKGVRDSLVTKSKSFTNKLASLSETLKDKSEGHTKLKESQPKEAETLPSPREEKMSTMTREQYADPFGSFEEEVPERPLSPGSNGSKSPDHSEGASREETLKLRARELIQKSKVEVAKQKAPLTKEEEERQQQLRERARKLIAETKAGLPVLPVLKSPTTEAPVVPQFRRSHSRESEHSEKRSGSNTPSSESRLSILEATKRSTPDKEPSPMPKVKSLYIEKELEVLEREQAAVDREGAEIEKKLRKAMDTIPNNPEEEEKLLHAWFAYVNKKNALQRRLEQLNILEKEQDLEIRCEMLNKELRALMSIDENEKTAEIKEREALLLQELVGIVNKRDELVQHMDEQQRAIDEDDAITMKLHMSGYRNQDEKNCVIQ